MSRQAFFIPAEERFVVDPGSLAPLLERQPQTVMLNPYRDPAISVLLFICGPVAVLWFIALVVVNAINRMRAGWARPHVLNEILEAHPSLTNGNTAPAVVLKVLGSWIGASREHAAPNAVFACLAHCMSALGHAVTRGELFGTNASARQALASKQVGGPKRLCRAATAKAFPHRAAASVVRCAAGNGEAAKALASKVERFVHANTVLRSDTALGFLTKSRA